MSDSVVSVFSNQARFQNLGGIPSNKGNLQGWPMMQGFLSIADFPTRNFMFNYVVKVFLKLARFHDLGPIPSKRGDM